MATVNSPTLCIHRNREFSFTYKNGQAQGADAIQEATVRSVMRQENDLAKDEISLDGQALDLDPAPGRLLYNTSFRDLKNQPYQVAASLRFDPETRQPQEIIYQSTPDRGCKEVRWNAQGDITEIKEVRQLLGDRRESVELHYDPQTGLLTYKETVEPVKA